MQLARRGRRCRSVVPSAAKNRLEAPSFAGWSTKCMAPVKSTAALRRSSAPSMSSVIQAVSSIVSVPWVTTTASPPSATCPRTRAEMAAMSSTDRSQEGTATRSTASSTTSPASSNSSPAPSMRRSLLCQAIVLPVATSTVRTSPLCQPPARHQVRWYSVERLAFDEAAKPAVSRPGRRVPVHFGTRHPALPNLFPRSCSPFWWTSGTGAGAPAEPGRREAVRKQGGAGMRA